MLGIPEGTAKSRLHTARVALERTLEDDRRVDSMHLTDDQLTAMLLDRVASPMPPDLTAAVLAGVRATQRQDRLLGRRTLRTGTLLVAAALLIGGSVLVAGFTGSMPIMPPPAPALVEATAPTEVEQAWTTDSSPAFTVTRDPFDLSAWYWRAATYDVIGLKEFARSRPGRWCGKPGRH